MVYSMGEVIGDGLIKLPFVDAVRRTYPEARISWCAAKGETVYAGPLKGVVAGLIDEVLTTPPTGADLIDFLHGRPFGGRRFDLVIDTQDNLRRSLFAKRAAARFISAAGDFRLSDARPPKDDPDRWPAAVTDRLAKLLSLGPSPAAPFAGVTLADPRAAAAAEALLPPGPTYVGLAPGAGGQSKRWPLENYLALASAQLRAGRTPVFFFGPDEAEDAARARAMLPGALFPEQERVDAFPDVRGPLLVIALARRLAAAVANDAGPGHMFAAADAPLASLHGFRRKAAKFKPAASRLELLVAEDYGEGMAAIPVAEVEAALDRLIRPNTETD